MRNALAPAFLFQIAGASLCAQEAEPLRLALVIGNRDYEQLSDLRNSENDATDVAAALERFEFAVTLRVNQGVADFDDSLDRLLSEAVSARNAGRKVDVVFYYAGHGISSEGISYLLPSDYPKDDLQASALRRYALELDYVVTKISSVSDRRIIILDSCRNDPFTDVPQADRAAISEGMSYLEVTPVGTGILYCAGVGQTSKDFLPTDDPMRRANGVCTRYLLEEFAAADSPFTVIAQRVQDRVYYETQRHFSTPQTPGIYDQIIGDFYFDSQSITEPQTFDAAVEALEQVTNRSLVAQNEFIVTGQTSGYQSQWVLDRAPPSPESSLPLDLPLLGVSINMFFHPDRLEDAQLIASQLSALGASVNQASTDFTEVGGFERGATRLLFLSDQTSSEIATLPVVRDVLAVASEIEGFGPIIADPVSALSSGPFQIQLF